MELSGSQMVIEALRKENVSVVFGYPGGAIMNVYDEVYKQNYFKHGLDDAFIIGMQISLCCAVGIATENELFSFRQI